MLKLPGIVHTHDWYITAFIGLAAFAAIILGGFTVPDYEVFVFGIPLCGALVMASVAHTQNTSPTIVALITFLAWFGFLSLGLGYGAYAFTAAALPLQDALFARIDAAMGIDLAGLRIATGKSWLLTMMLEIAYTKTIVLLVMPLAILFVRRDYERVRDAVSIYTLGVLTTLIISTLLPAVGAYPHLNMAHIPSGYLKYAGTDSYVEHYMALRDGTMRILPVTGWRGLITFPSFHAIVALTGLYAAYPIRWLFWPAALFTGPILISTLPVGGHYAIDVIAAVAIVAVSILWVDRRRKTLAPMSCDWATQVAQPGPAAAATA